MPHSSASSSEDVFMSCDTLCMPLSPDNLVNMENLSKETTSPIHMIYNAQPKEPQLKYGLSNGKNENHGQHDIYDASRAHSKPPTNLIDKTNIRVMQSTYSNNIRNPDALHLHESTTMDIPLDLLVKNKYPKSVTKRVLARVLNGKSGNTCAPGRKALNNEGFSQYMDDTPSSISEIEDIVQEDQDAFKPSTSLPTAETGHVERPKVDDHTNAESIRLTMDQSTEDSMCSDKFIGYKDIIFQQQKLLQTQVYQQQEILEALKRIQLTSDMPPPPLQGSPDPKYGRPKSAFSVVSASVSPAYSPKQRKESENIDPATSQPNASRPKSPNPGLQVSYNHTHTPVESHYSTDASENGFIDQTMPNMSQKPEYPSSSSDTTTSIFPPRIFIHANNNNNTKQPMAQQYQQYLQPVGITPYGVQPVIYYGAQPILKEDEEEDECQCSECLDDNSHIYSSTAPSSNAGNNDKPKDNQHPEQQKPTPPKTPFYRKPKNLIMIAGLMAMGLKAMNGMERKRKKKAEEEYKAMHKKEKKKEKEKHKKSQGEQEKLVQETVQNANPTSQHILVQSASVPQPNMLVYPAYRPPPPQPVSVITYSSYCSLGNQHNSTPNYPSLPPRAQTTLNAPSNPNLIQNPSNVNCNPCNSNPQNYVYHSFSNNIGTHFGPRF